MRLIDADALKDMMLQAYNDALPEFDMPWKKKMAHSVTLSFMADIDEAPTVDAVEVRHGENIGEDYDAVDQFVCSKCGIELQGWYRVERDMDDGEETHHEYVMRYCPNCGAKMDGGAVDAAD